MRVRVVITSRSMALAAVVGWALTGGAAVMPEAPAARPESTSSPSGKGQKVVPVPPPLPPAKPPIDFFRELLAMTPEQREQALAGRATESRKLITAKIQEYEALAPEQRELRLRVTELRYYVLPLLSAPLSGRGPMLDRIPSELRPLVEQRLRRWDGLPPEKQKELLDNETWLRYAAEAASTTPAQQEHSLTNMPNAQRQLLETAVAKWRTLGEDRRQELTARFEEFFGLKPLEREKTLGAFAELERQQMKKSLESFSRLAPEKRARCLGALDKLAQLSPKERQEFLENAERWQALTPAERKAWRDLVFNLSMPPKPPMPPPPSPGPPRTLRPSTPVATNR